MRLLMALWLACVAMSALASPASIEIVNPNEPRGVVDHTTRRYSTLSVRVRNETGEALPGVPVTFAVPSSGPGFVQVDPSRLTVTTDSMGIATLADMVSNFEDGFFNVTANTAPAVPVAARFVLSQAPRQFGLCFLPFQPLPSFVRLSVSPASSVPGQAVTLTAVFSGSRIGLFDNDVVLANVPAAYWEGGEISHVVTHLTGGTHRLQAKVLPACGFAPPYTSASVVHRVVTGAAPERNYTDMWWNAAESGWGMSFVQHASNQAFIAWFHYAADGKPQWLVIPGGVWIEPHVFSGVIHRTTGPALNLPFNASAVTVTPVGTAVFEFSDADRGTFTYRLEEVAGRKSITRQPF